MKVTRKEIVTVEHENITTSFTPDVKFPVNIQTKDSFKLHLSMSEAQDLWATLGKLLDVINDE